MATWQRIGYFLATCAVVVLAAACSSSEGELGTDQLPFTGTRTYQFANVTGAGFEAATLTLAVTDLVADSRASSTDQVRLQCTSSDNQFQGTLLNVTGLSANRLLATGSTATGVACNFVLTLFNNGTSARLQLSNSLGSVSVLGNQVTNEPGGDGGGGGGTGPVDPAGDPRLALSTTVLNFGPTATTKTFAISNSGTGNLAWSVSPQQGFLTVDPTSGTGEATITVTADRTGLTAGTTSGTVVVTSNGGTLTVTAHVTVP